MSNSLFNAMVQSASLAASADNNQPWFFRDWDARLLVYLDTTRLLPSDVRGMFGRIYGNIS